MVTLFVSPTCPSCHTAQAFLSKLGCHFDTIDISESREAETYVRQRAGRVVLPALQVDGLFFTGFSIGQWREAIQNMIERNRL